MMRHFSWKAFLSMVLLVVFFVAVYSTIGYAQIPPIADLNGPYTSSVGKRIHFDASGSFDPDGVIIQYIWDFGDGTVELVTTPTHTHVYESVDTYPVLLIVVDNTGFQGAGATTAEISSGQTQDFCKGNFDYDQDVDGTDAAVFKDHFGRSAFKNPCPPDGPAPVPKTWQAYSEATGDDGDLQKGVMWPGYGKDRFTDNGDGTVTDHLTGLIWLRDANCSLFNAPRTWSQAIGDCNGLSAGWCGLTDGSSAGDWRLPNYKELISLNDAENYNPALPSGHPFTNVQSGYYWSSTTFADLTDGALYVHMGNGYVGGSLKTSGFYYVWPVRGGY